MNPLSSAGRQFLRFVLRLNGLIGMLVLGCASPEHSRVEAITITEYGILEYSGGVAKKDPTSSIGADLTTAPAISLLTPTDRIPLRVGLSFGIAFVVKGPADQDSIPITVILKSSLPCKLRTTSAVVYQNDTTVNVRVGIRRFVGARIANDNDNPCVEPPRPGIETFELYYRGTKFAEKRFVVVSDDNFQ